MTDRGERLRDLPAVDVLAGALDHGLTTAERTAIARQAIEEARTRVLSGEAADAAEIAEGLATATRLAEPIRIINASGVILHTNLGRAPLADSAAAALSGVGSGYSNTELDRADGSRGERAGHTRRLLRLLTGAEDALVVNNNAAAVMLTLAALAGGRSVPVSRGELIEIGGSYRLPDVMKASGARLVEVGTTNKTRLADYETALQLYDCGLVLKVHAANYQISGFTSEVDVAQLSSLSPVPLVYDIGSGLLDNRVPWLEERPDWIEGEPGAVQALNDGADLVLFSGDKMLGGPQAGVIVGSSRLVGQIRAHPIARAVRVSSAIDAAMAATLEMYLKGNAAEIPFWRMAATKLDGLRPRAEAVAHQIGGQIESGDSLAGAGSAPSARIPTVLIRVPGRQDVFSSLLRGPHPILARRDRGDLVLDLRTVEPDTDDIVVEALRRCL